MASPKKLFQKSLAPLFGGLLTVFTGCFLLIAPLGEKLQEISYDLPFLIWENPTNNEVVIVYIDEDSYANLGQNYGKPFDRSLHAKLLRRLRREGARAAVFDIVFVGASNPANDEQFAQAIKDFGKVTLAAEKVSNGSRGNGIAPLITIEIPLDKFSNEAATLGTDDLNADTDLIVRRHGAVTPNGLIPIPTLSWASARFLGAPITRSTNDWWKTRWVNYYGPPGIFQSVSYFRALSSNELSSGFFRDKVVFVGSRTFTKNPTDRKDEFPSPFSYIEGRNSPKFMPGVELQATLFLNLMHGDWLSRLSRFQETTLVMMIGLLFGMGLPLLQPSRAYLAAITGMLAVNLFGYFMLTRAHTWFAWLIVDLEIAIAISWSLLIHSINWYVQNRGLETDLPRNDRLPLA